MASSSRCNKKVCAAGEHRRDRDAGEDERGIGAQAIGAGHPERVRKTDGNERTDEGGERGAHCLVR
jgi:hypothetical protein